MTVEPAATKLRADARRNIAVILEAATGCLAADPEASLAEITAAAGVGRMTLYGHFESRARLVSAVVERAIADTESRLSQVDLEGDPVEALDRLLRATWLLTYRYGGLIVAAEKVMTVDESARAHRAPAARVRAVLRRGRQQHRLRTDLPLQWQVTLIQGIVHAAWGSVQRGEMSAQRAPELIVKTVLAALAAPEAS